MGFIVFIIVYNALFVVSYLDLLDVFLYFGKVGSGCQLSVYSYILLSRYMRPEGHGSSSDHFSAFNHVPSPTACESYRTPYPPEQRKKKNPQNPKHNRLSEPSPAPYSSLPPSPLRRTRAPPRPPSRPSRPPPGRPGSRPWEPQGPWPFAPHAAGTAISHRAASHCSVYVVSPHR